MTTELTKSLMCIQMRSGVEIWLESDRVKILQNILEKITGSKFINFDNQTINTADIVGIFSAEAMADYSRRKNGEWKCQSNKWHQRGERCECLSLKDKQLVDRRIEAIKNCKRKCQNGFIKAKSGAMTACECVKKLSS